jgi:cell division protease FtsH
VDHPVAHALEAHKTITGQDVEAIIEGRPGPLVDGRPYVRPEFLADAEAYHEVAAAAHVAQSSIEIPLPVMAPVAATPGNGHESWAPPTPDQGNGNGAGNGNGHGS